MHMLFQSSSTRSCKLALSTGDALEHVDAAMEDQHDLHMPREANDEGHSTGWLDLAFAMQRQPAILRAQPPLASVRDARHRLIIVISMWSSAASQP